MHCHDAEKNELFRIESKSKMKNININNQQTENTLCERMVIKPATKGNKSSQSEKRKTKLSNKNLSEIIDLRETNNNNNNNSNSGENIANKQNVSKTTKLTSNDKSQSSMSSVSNLSGSSRINLPRIRKGFNNASMDESVQGLRSTVSSNSNGNRSLNHSSDDSSRSGSSDAPLSKLSKKNNNININSNNNSVSSSNSKKPNSKRTIRFTKRTLKQGSATPSQGKSLLSSINRMRQTSAQTSAVSAVSSITTATTATTTSHHTNSNNNSNNNTNSHNNSSNNSVGANSLINLIKPSMENKSVSVKSTNDSVITTQTTSSGLDNQSDHGTTSSDFTGIHSQQIFGIGINRNGQNVVIECPTLEQLQAETFDAQQPRYIENYGNPLPNSLLGDLIIDGMESHKIPKNYKMIRSQVELVEYLI